MEDALYREVERSMHELNAGTSDALTGPDSITRTHKTQNAVDRKKYAVSTCNNAC